MKFSEFKNIVERPREKSLSELRKALDFANTKLDKADESLVPSAVRYHCGILIERIEGEIAIALEALKEPEKTPGNV